MKKKLNWSQNERVDVPDASALHDLADDSRRGDARGVLSQASEGPVIIRGFTCRVNPADDTQILITPGVALMRELLPDGSVEEGQLVNLEGQDDEVLDLSGRLQPADYGIWVRFLYRAGETRNRAKWRPDLSPEREQVVLMETRQIAGISVQAATDSPGEQWFQIASAHWDGGLVAADLTDARQLFFEGAPSGTGNPASSWSTADFSRSTDRSTNGVKSLRQFVAAMQRRVLELAGRPKWYTAPVWGENVRSAGPAVTVRPAAHDGDTQTAHLTLGTAAQNRVTLTLMMVAGNLNHRTAGDPRDEVVFLPMVSGASVVEVDCSSSSIVPSGDTFRRRFRGGADLRRTAGNNDLILTPAAAAAHGFVAHFDGMTFSSADGSGALVRIRNAADDLIFTNCVFDGTLDNTMSVLVRVEAAAGARVAFVNCRFRLGDGFGQTGLLVSGGADVRMIGGSITGAGARGLNVTASPTGIVSLTGVRIGGMQVCVKASDDDGLSFAGCFFEPTDTLFDIPGMPAAGGSEAYYNAGHAARGMLSGNWLESRSGTVFFSTARDRTLTHTDRTITGTGSDGDLVDFVGRYLRAVSGRVHLDSANLRFQKLSDTVVALLDAAGNAPVSSTIQFAKLVLGAQTNNALATFNRNLLPKAWGVIEMNNAWIAGGDVGDKATGADGYYRSRTVRGDGTALTVRAYYLGDSGAAWNLTADPGVGERNAAIFKVSGLGLPDERYVVHAWATFDGTFSYDYSLKVPDNRLEVDVFSQGSDSFFLSANKVVDSGTRTVLDPGAFLGVSKPEVRIYFTIHAICDSATFVNGGAG